MHLRRPFDHLINKASKQFFYTENALKSGKVCVKSRNCTVSN
nr:MAG TPA: hypothetical protein [Caudoviricetes sp.]